MSLNFDLGISGTQAKKLLGNLSLGSSHFVYVKQDMCHAGFYQLDCPTLFAMLVIKVLTSRLVGQLFWHGASAHFKHL